MVWYRYGASVVQIVIFVMDLWVKRQLLEFLAPVREPLQLRLLSVDFEVGSLCCCRPGYCYGPGRLKFDRTPGRHIFP